MRWVRQSILWSYRFDVFVVMSAAYAAGAILLALFVVPFNLNAFDAMRRSDEFRILAEAHTIVRAANRLAPTEDAVRQLTSLGQKIRANEYSLSVEKEIRRRLEAASTKEEQAKLSDNSPTLAIIRIATLALALRNELHNKTILLGNALNLYMPPFVIFSILGLLYIYYSIQNVFYTRHIHIAFKHPDYSLLVLELSIIVLFPFICLYLIETLYFGGLGGLSPLFDTEAWRRIPMLTAGRTAGYIPSSYLDLLLTSRLDFDDPLDQTVVEQLVSTGSRGGLSTEIAALLAFASWMAGGLWITRRFGGGFFLGCSLACAIIAATFMTVVPRFDIGAIGPLVNSVLHPLNVNVAARSRTETTLLGCEVVFFAIFLIGIVLGQSRWKPYLICAGYIGATTLATYLLASVLNVRQGAVPPIVAFLIVVFVTIISVSAIEMLMRRIMFRFIYEPQ